MANPLHIFYSWQSELPGSTNRVRIRACLRMAASALEKQSTDSCFRIEIDEATRDLPGSPNIPAAILGKIQNAEIFIADISTVNPEPPPNHRRAPNANVMFELGYAVAQLGWGRIILLLNKKYGDVQYAPFDIDRHRVAVYHATEDAQGKELKKEEDNLTELLTTAVDAILRAKPPRPKDEVARSPSEVKH